MSRFLNALKLAVQELLRNWTRSALTALGVLIGVAAVILMVNLGRGATASIEGDLASMGNNLIILSSGRGGGPRANTPAPAFDQTDVDAIKRQVPYLSAVAPQVVSSVTARSGGEEWSTSVTGTSDDYFIATGTEIATGRTFTSGEVRSGAGVCVVGETIVEELFGVADPLDAEIRVGDVSCTVIGTLVAKGENTMGMDQDDVILAPTPFVQRRLTGSSDIGTVLISVDTEAHMTTANAILDEVMRDRRHVVSNDTLDFEIRDTSEMASMVSGITSILTAFLAAVAGVSLLVGGIGIMNIMLVSVTERTREIGIRMSIGALEGDEMMQFLVEAVVHSLLGGVIGVLLGVTGSTIGAYFLSVPIVVDPTVVVIALLVSAGMGILFGWWPANRAAKLEPIDALRHT